MKNIKFWLPIIGVTLLFSSCILKSLNPYYTPDLICYEKKLIGNWEDSEQGHWEIISGKDEFDMPHEYMDEEFFDKFLKPYQNGYQINYTKDSITTKLLAMPFKINNQLFLDFLAIEHDKRDITALDLYNHHRINFHSLAKLDITSENKLSIKWLPEEKVSNLIEEHKIKIKHEILLGGPKPGDILITAPSEELVKFIVKYMASEDNDKWKTDVDFSLQRK